MERDKREDGPGVKEWFTTGEVGKLVGLSHNTIIRYAHKGLIQALRTPGGRFRIFRKDLLAFQRKYGFPVAFQAD